MSIGEKIKQLRKDKKMTQSQLANELDRSIRTVQKYENNEIEPNLEVLNKLIEIFDIFPDELLSELPNYNYIAQSSSYSTSLKELIPFDNKYMQNIITCLVENEDLNQSILFDEDLDMVTDMVKNYIISLIRNISAKNMKLITEHPELIPSVEDTIEDPELLNVIKSFPAKE